MKQKALKILGVILVAVTGAFLALMLIMFATGTLENDMVQFGVSELVVTIILSLPPLTIGVLLLKYSEPIQ